MYLKCFCKNEIKNRIKKCFNVCKKHNNCERKFDCYIKYDNCNSNIFPVSKPVPTIIINRGVTGPTGPTGADGITPTFTIGTVTTLEPEDEATVTITGTAPDYVLNFGIPRGVTGVS